MKKSLGEAGLTPCNLKGHVPFWGPIERSHDADCFLDVGHFRGGEHSNGVERALEKQRQEPGLA